MSPGLDADLAFAEALAEDDRSDSTRTAYLSDLHALQRYLADHGEPKKLRLARPVESMGTVIHRDGTFAYGGDRYRVFYDGPGWGYEILSLPDLKCVADGFFRLWEVRNYVDHARRQHWRRLGEDRVPPGPAG